MRENPRPTRHLEQLETAQLGKLAPGSVSGPAWDLVALPVPPDGGAPEAPEADAIAHRSVAVAPAPPAPPVEPAPRAASVTSPSTPSTALRRLTMVAVGCGVLAAFALGIGGLTMLWADRPDAETTGPVERTALDLPLIPADDAHDTSTGERAEARLRGADDAEAGEPRGDGADADLLGDGTASLGDRPDQGGSGEGVAGAGGSSGGSGGPGSGGGSGAGGGTGTGGGGTATPTGGPPPPASEPTTDPTEEPTPKPTPSASDEPTPEPTPSPTVSPTPTPTGAPVSPNAGG
ncbi:hypothetical protein [Promicromonospora sp. NPDC023805]|uniref:hypothetical protein n=1 Tax=Promicromonospora sp. NPDC023805 TaxID=3154696 RepID=UPI0033DB8863